MVIEERDLTYRAFGEPEYDSLVSLKLLTRNTRLVEARKAKGLTQTEAAHQAGIAVLRLQEIERLHRLPRDEDKVKIANFLEMSIDYLFPGILMKAIEDGVFSHRDAQLAEPEIISLEEARAEQLTYDGEAELIKGADRELLRERIATVLDTLDPREKQVLEMRFGLVDGRRRTLPEVAQEMPRVKTLLFGVGRIAREQVRQIEAKALRKLRHPLRSRHLKDYWDYL